MTTPNIVADTRDKKQKLDILIRKTLDRESNILHHTHTRTGNVIGTEPPTDYELVRLCSLNENVE